MISGGVGQVLRVRVVRHVLRRLGAQNLRPAAGASRRLSLSIYISLSLYIYIYIYLFMSTFSFVRLCVFGLLGSDSKSEDALLLSMLNTYSKRDSDIESEKQNTKYGL